MFDLINPQRFYQFSFSDAYSNGKVRITSVIDLKAVIEISMAEYFDGKLEIRIEFANKNSPPRCVVLEETDVASEIYSKLVTAWTTYKLSSEK